MLLFMMQVTQARGGGKQTDTPERGSLRIEFVWGGAREERGKEKKEGVRGEGREAVVTFSEWGRTERGVGGEDWRGGRRSLKGEDWE